MAIENTTWFKRVQQGIRTIETPQHHGTNIHELCNADQTDSIKVLGDGNEKFPNSRNRLKLWK